MFNPFAFYRQTQGYSATHRAYDYGMDVGTPLPACSSGTVRGGYLSDAGYYVDIVRSHGSYTRYCHMREQGVRGAVSQGDVVGYSGNSGTTTGPHLHVFDVDADGTRCPPFTTGTDTAGGDITPIIETGVTTMFIAQNAEDSATTNRCFLWGETITPVIISDSTASIYTGAGVQLKVMSRDRYLWLLADARARAKTHAGGPAGVDPAAIAAEVIRQQKLPGN